jgi:hypothetical protein
LGLPAPTAWLARGLRASLNPQQNNDVTVIHTCSSGAKVVLVVEEGEVECVREGVVPTESGAGGGLAVVVHLPVQGMPQPAQ